jgi:hypothetical protein
VSATTPKNLANFIWQVADLLRGDYKRADYGKVILPFTVLRRLECVLEPTRDDVLAEMEKWEAKGVEPAPFLPKKSGHSFYNVTKHNLTAITGAPDDAAKNLMRYIEAIVGGHVSQHVCLVRPDPVEIHGPWLAYFLSSHSVQEVLVAGQYGGTKTQLSLPDIRNIRVPDVSISDQRHIAVIADERVVIIRRNKDLRAQQLRLIEELQRTLVAAAVTGQIEVSTARGAGLS